MADIILLVNPYNPFTDKMKTLFISLALILGLAVGANAQTAADVKASQTKMMAPSTPCNGAPEAFRTFIEKFSTDSEFMESRLNITPEQREKYADLLVPANFKAMTPVERDGEEYYQAWGELQYNKAYLCCGYVDLYDTHTFEFKRGQGGLWYLFKVVPGE